MSVPPISVFLAKDVYLLVYNIGANHLKFNALVVHYGYECLVENPGTW